MKIVRTIATSIVVFGLACSPGYAQMPGSSDQADMHMTAASRQQLIDNLIKKVNSS